MPPEPLDHLLFDQPRLTHYTACMLDREACERRVYRLATLLTGNPVAATKVIHYVIEAQPDLSQLDSAHMDRLTVLRSRELPVSILAFDKVPHRLAEALANLSPQQREAWVFARVYGAPEREIAKAMDCSLTATLRHLEQADTTLRARLGESGAADAPRIILEYSMQLDVPEFYRAQRRRQRQLKLGLLIAALVAASFFIAMLLIWWSRPLSGN